jgi:hypothetical protein
MVAGYPLGSSVEEEYASVPIMGNNSLHEIVENMLQILLVDQDFFESCGLHGPTIRLPPTTKGVL